ncbi:MAG: RNA polymerase sigma factor [Verrucomicrobiota bacterium]
MIATCPHETPLLTRPVVETDDEAELVQRARQRDQQAFARLYRRHVGRVHALCRRMTGDIPRAEELTQTVFVTLWKKLGQFRGESAFASWLHRLAVNTVLMDFRTTRRREARVCGTEDPTALETPVTPPGAGLRLDMEQAIAALPPRARVVFVLHDVEGYTHEEIAALLELETGTTKAQLHRARQLLREALR